MIHKTFEQLQQDYDYSDLPLERQVEELKEDKLSAIALLQVFALEHQDLSGQVKAYEAISDSINNLVQANAVLAEKAAELIDKLEPETKEEQ